MQDYERISCTPSNDENSGTYVCRPNPLLGCYSINQILQTSEKVGI